MPKPILTPAACRISSERSPASRTSRELPEANLGKAQFLAEAVHGVEGDQGRHDKGVGAGDVIGGGAVDQIAVLDRAHPEIDRAADRLGRIGVGHHIGMPGARLLDDRAHFIFAVLQVPHRVVGRGDTTRGHDLDLRCPFAQLVARRTATFRDAVGDAGEPGAALAASAADDRAGARPQIAVPAGLAQRLTRRKHPRPPNEPLLDRLGEPAIGPAGVADRGEAALQHAFEHACSLQRHQADRPLRQPRQHLVDGDHMDMRVDQPGHQGAAPEIDRLGGGADDRPVRDLADSSALDQHVATLAALLGAAVDDRAIGEDDPARRNHTPRYQIRLFAVAGRWQSAPYRDQGPSWTQPFVWLSNSSCNSKKTPFHI